MLNESYERTRAMLRKYAKEHHMVKRPCLHLGLFVPVRFCLRARPAAHTRSIRPRCCRWRMHCWSTKR